jgi:RNA polymerase sigma factor (sigma-70 family)
MNSMHSSSSEKSDEWLVEALRGDDPQEVDSAMRDLQARYEAEVRRYAYHRIAGHSWVDLDDVVQETFTGFYKYIKGHKVDVGVRALLLRIAKYKCADAINKQEKERKFEYGIPLPGESGTAVFLEMRERDQFARQLPFTSPLSECQRVVFALRSLYEYPPRVVARLLGKERGTVDTHLSAANKRVREYLQSMDYELDVASRNWPWTKYRMAEKPPGLVVERFANCISPQLTADELKPLGLTAEEFQNNYVTSLMLPWAPIDESEEPRRPFLILTQRMEWDSMQEMFVQLKKDPRATDQISPEECLLKLDADLDNEYIILSVEQILEFFPEPENWAEKDISENTYISVHHPKLTIPVSLGFFDRSLLTPEVHERWPFLTEEAGL